MVQGDGNENGNKINRSGQKKIYSFREELWYVLTKKFVACVPVRFFFSRQLIFTLLAAIISHFLTSAMKFACFFPTKFVSFILNHLLQLFLCYPSECRQKNNVEKGGSTLLLFFVCKSPEGHPISRQNTSSCQWSHTC